MLSLLVEYHGLIYSSWKITERRQWTESSLDLVMATWLWCFNWFHDSWCFMHLEAEAKWRPFCRRHFHMLYLMKTFEFQIKLHCDILSQHWSRRRKGNKPLPEPMVTHFAGAYMRHPASVSSTKNTNHVRQLQSTSTKIAFCECLLDRYMCW